jgi:transcriptional regulator with XRE-family HTH domain
MGKLQEYREKLNLTQEELAEKAGVSVRTIQRIEAGARPKGYTLRVLSQALGISSGQLTGETAEQIVNYQLIKLINLSSLPLIILPPGNVILPLVLMYRKKEINPLTKQIVSIQILWTLISGLITLLTPFINRIFSLDNTLTLIMIIAALLINIYIIIKNTISIDRQHRLFIKLGFSFL